MSGNAFTDREFDKLFVADYKMSVRWEKQLTSMSKVCYILQNGDSSLRFKYDFGLLSAKSRISSTGASTVQVSWPKLLFGYTLSLVSRCSQVDVLSDSFGARLTSVGGQVTERLELMYSLGKKVSAFYLRKALQHSLLVHVADSDTVAVQWSRTLGDDSRAVCIRTAVKNRRVLLDLAFRNAFIVGLPTSTWSVGALIRFPT